MGSISFIYQNNTSEARKKKRIPLFCPPAPEDAAAGYRAMDYIAKGKTAYRDHRSTSALRGTADSFLDETQAPVGCRSSSSGGFPGVPWFVLEPAARGTLPGCVPSAFRGPGLRDRLRPESEPGNSSHSLSGRIVFVRLRTTGRTVVAD